MTMPVPILPIAEEPCASPEIDQDCPKANEGPAAVLPAWQDIYDELRLNPPSIPNWDSDAQHPLFCDCDVCVTFYTAMAKDLLAKKQNGN